MNMKFLYVTCETYAGETYLDGEVYALITAYM